MWNKTVTIYIDDTSIRLLEIHGDRVKKWADVKLEPGLVKSGIVNEEAEVASRIKLLLKNQKVKARRITLGFSGLHSLTRPVTLPMLPKAMLAEAVAREARRVLPVPMDQLYLSWRILPSPKGRIKIFMAATPRKTADSLVKTVQRAGLDPYRMSIKSLALTKALPVNTAILVDVQPNEFDVVILADGVAQPIRTVTLPSEEQTWEQKLNMINSDVDRTIKFYDSNNQEKPLAPDVPLYVSGELLGKLELQTFLAKTTARPVYPLSTALKGADQVDMSRYMVNIALALKTGPPGREATFPVADLNVLPAPYQSKPISLTRVVAIPGGVVAMGIVIPMVIMMQNASANINNLQTQLTTIQQITTEKMAQKVQLTKNVTDLQKQNDSAKTALDNISLSLDSLTTQQEIVNGDLRTALSLLPDNVTLVNISETNGNLNINGQAISDQDILAYARSLQMSGRYSETTVSSMRMVPPAEGQTDGHTEFNLILERKG